MTENSSYWLAGKFGDMVHALVVRHGTELRLTSGQVPVVYVNHSPVAAYPDTLAARDIWQIHVMCCFAAGVRTLAATPTAAYQVVEPGMGRIRCVFEEHHNIKSLRVFPDDLDATWVTAHTRRPPSDSTAALPEA
jgi:hypothetical protein